MPYGISRQIICVTAGMSVDTIIPAPVRPRRGPPRILTFGSALTCGLLIALALHILLIDTGWGLGSVWRGSNPSPTAGLHAAIAWWVIAAGAFVGSWAIGKIWRLRIWRRSQQLRRLSGLILVIGLAVAGHAAGPPAANGAGITLTVNFAAASLGVVMAFLGAYLAVRTQPEATRLS